jgi:hypothetical protein
VNCTSVAGMGVNCSIVQHEAVKNFDLSSIRVILCAASTLPRTDVPCILAIY